MSASVMRSQDGHRLTGEGPTCDSINRFLEHLGTRRYSPATVRAYAFDLSNFTTFLGDRRLELAEVAPTDLFDYLDWQQSARRSVTGKVVAIGGVRVAPATMNRRIASVRGLFDRRAEESRASHAVRLTVTSPRAGDVVPPSFPKHQFPGPRSSDRSASRAPLSTGSPTGAGSSRPRARAIGCRTPNPGLPGSRPRGEQPARTGLPPCLWTGRKPPSSFTPPRYMFSTAARY
jgi:hypothetical protein